jgi:hypothetical protein
MLHYLYVSTIIETFIGVKKFRIYIKKAFVMAPKSLSRSGWTAHDRTRPLLCRYPESNLGAPLGLGCARGSVANESLRNLRAGIARGRTTSGGESDEARGAGG